MGGKFHTTINLERRLLLTHELVLAYSFSSLFSIPHKFSSSFWVSCSFLQMAGLDGAWDGDLGHLGLDGQGAGRSAKKR